MEHLRAAIIGCGKISRAHARAISKCSAVELAVVCDSDFEKAHELAQQYGCTAISDYADILKMDIQAVHICLPHYLHVPVSQFMIDNGINVLCEKPMGISLEKSVDLINSVNSSDKIYGICFQNRYNATSIEAKKIIKNGEIGRIKGVRAIITWSRDEAYYASGEWRGKISTSGGGLLINQAIHTLDLMQWLVGDFETLSGNVFNHSKFDGIDVEDTSEVFVKYKNGATGIFYGSICNAEDSSVEITIIGEGGKLVLNDDLTVIKDGKPYKLNLKRSEISDKKYWGSGHGRLINEFYSSLKSGTEFAIGINDAVRSQQIVDSIYLSSKGKKEIVF